MHSTTTTLPSSLLITGVSGHLARLAAEHLFAHTPPPAHLIGTTRTPERAQALAQAGMEVRHADLGQPDGLATALQGAQRMLLVSTGSDHAGPVRVAQHRHAIEAAMAARVQRIVYTSLQQHPGGALDALVADHRATEQMLAACAIPERVVLRNAFYAEMLLTTLPLAMARGVWHTLRRDAGVAYIPRAECAVAAAEALAQSGVQDLDTLDITGPEALSPLDVAGIVHQEFGVRIRVEEVSDEDYRMQLEATGMPAPMAGVMVYLERGMASGAMGTVAGGFGQLTGRAPQGVREFLRKHGAVLRASAH